MVPEIDVVVDVRLDPLSLGQDERFLRQRPQRRLVDLQVTFASRLPAAYSDRERVPAGLLVAENILRVPAFVMPLFLPLTVGDSWSRAGWITYGVGASLYLASWLAQTHFPDSRLSQSLLGRLAPAYTPSSAGYTPRTQVVTTFRLRGPSFTWCLPKGPAFASTRASASAPR